MAAGPDFLCVGMAKAGTGWLGDQLRAHPEFWMTPVQELGYLGHDYAKLKSANRRLARLKDKPERARKASPGRRAATDRDIQFLEDMVACTGQPRDLERYISLFRHKGDLKSGDISPGYTLLEEDMIAQIAERLPDIRVLLLLRDPVARSWSHICMWHRNEKFDASVLDDPDDFRAYLASAKVARQRSFPTQVVTHWQHAAPKVAFRYFFFDNIVKEPDRTRAEILEFLGADPSKGGELPPDFNRKSQSSKLELSKTNEEILVQHYREELLASAEMFGDCAKEWAARYGV